MNDLMNDLQAVDNLLAQVEVKGNSVLFMAKIRSQMLPSLFNKMKAMEEESGRQTDK